MARTTRAKPERTDGAGRAAGRAGRWPSRPALAVIGMTLLAAALGWLTAPRPTGLGAETTGDAALADEVRELVGDTPYRGMAVALIEDGQLRTAGLGTTGGAEPTPVDADTPFETGSVTKVFTGMLLADLEDDGHLSRETRLGEIYPDTDFADPQVADVTLAELSNHLSGLPSTVPSGVGGFLRTSASTWMGTNPLGGVRLGDLLDAAATAQADDRGTPIYPNFGVALLGHAIADHEQSTYAALVSDRIVGPLGMRDTTIQAPDDAPPPGHARPQRSSGAPVEAWVGTGELPSGGGGLWSTASDLAGLVTATRDGTAPGAAAAEARYEHAADRRVGLGWLTWDYDGQTVTWHNGATDGSSSFVGFTDEAAVVVRRAQRQPVDRVGLATQAAWSVLIFAVIWRAGLWDRIPPLLWIGSVAAFGAAVAISARRWPTVPTIATGRPWQRWSGLGFGIAAALAYSAVLITTLARLS